MWTTSNQLVCSKPQSRSSFCSLNPSLILIVAIISFSHSWLYVFIFILSSVLGRDFSFWYTKSPDFCPFKSFHKHTFILWSHPYIDFITKNVAFLHVNCLIYHISELNCKLLGAETGFICVLQSVIYTNACYVPNPGLLLRAVLCEAWVECEGGSTRATVSQEFTCAEESRGSW